MSLLVVLLSAGLAAALPPEIGTVGPSASSTTVHQVRNAHYVRSGPPALAKAYQKYGAPLPSDLAAAVANLTTHQGWQARRATSGSVSANPAQYDVEYLSPVQIGTPPQTLNLDFDTGSADLWVFSTETRTTNGQAMYDPAKSSTANKSAGATWSITYGDGSSCSGDVYVDSVTVGGVTVKAQAVEFAQTVSDQFMTDSDLDGLMGLAFSTLNTVRPSSVNTWFDNAVAGGLGSNVFTVDLKHDAPGSYTFGSAPAALAITTPLTYTPVDASQGFWQFTASGYSVGSGSFKTSKISPSIADTGTTLLLLPTTIVKTYYQAIRGAKYDNSQGGYVFPCSTTAPSFAFGIGSARITIPGEYMNFAPASGSNCFGGLQDNSGIGFSIFGDVALKAAMVVFSLQGGNPQLGWAGKTL